MPKKDAGGGWSGQTELKVSSVKSALGYKGYSDGLVNEQCSHMSSPIMGLLNGTAGQREVCNKILQGVFQNDVSEKRYCPYQAPGIKSHFDIL
ncbi:hypothetical protein MHLP_03510 [Candidatus Mycoplasma haematolamae str. Purdue]|uniref:Uncharacterized protein n=1 Tax=Mycoplasma haematolamae (strain Purdue) TaxID=1212765 RepID=I7C6V9_MYCHA|nr:hypothetical protein [Candidatus Mycoplasma haematolamae]AFO52282.1 hypothetical protein MHLP_03510 [Candidatus Mycoplasma haematolamae str. Purdue]